MNEFNNENYKKINIDIHFFILNLCYRNITFVKDYSNILANCQPIIRKKPVKDYLCRVF